MSWSVISGPATVSTEGVVTPTGSGLVRLRVVDANAEFAEIDLMVRGSLNVSAARTELQVGSSITYTLSGGIPPITSSVESGGAVIYGSSIYATGPDGTTVVRFTDSLGATADLTLTVALPLSFTSPAISVPATAAVTLNVIGGFSPFTFSKVTGGGSIDANTGVFTAPAVAGSAQIKVTDRLGHTATTNIAITDSLLIQPTSLTLAINNNHTFTAINAVPPLVYSVVSGEGVVNSSTGLFSASTNPGTTVIKVTDATGSESTATVTVNPALSISPANVERHVNQSASFSASGGVPPFTYSIVSGGGNINAASGVFAAPSTPANIIVLVTDALGNTASSNVTVFSALAISPSNHNITTSGSHSFVASGGKTPYTYSIVSGGGSINSSSGSFTAPGTAGSVVVRATDALGGVASASVTVYAAPSISPSSKNLAILNTTTFSAAGGLPPYTYTLVSGSGSIASSTGLYNAPASAGSATVRVTDLLGGQSTANITIHPALQISPVSSNILAGGSVSFSATGGVAPITYTLVSGPGSVGSSTGSYSVGMVGGTAVIRATDTEGNTSDATVVIEPPVQISPATITIAVNNSTTFSNIGGQAPFTYSIVSGSGSINASTGAYTASASSGTTVIRITDNVGSTADATVTINPALSLNSSANFAVVDGSVTFSGVNGAPPYSYSIISGGGSINASNGALTAPSTAGTVNVRVTDSLSNTADLSVAIVNNLSLTPSSPNVLSSGSQSFSTTGGQGPYVYDIVSGGGSIDPSTGLFSAPAVPGSVVVRVTDSLGLSTSTTVTVYNPLAISPLTANLGPNYNQSFTASGGVGGATFSIISGGGSINSGTGAFTAPGSPGTVIVRVTDSGGNTQDATVTVNASLSITPNTHKLPIRASQLFTAAGGSGVYSYSVFSGGRRRQLNLWSLLGRLDQ